MLEKNKLVSIVITTYNSKDTIIDTLESAFNQTYNNIELVIADDYSTDNTTEIIDTWIKEKEHRFCGVIKCYSQENHGVSYNTNEGVYNSSGEWVALIAGDDVLLPNYVKDNVKLITENDDIQIVQSKQIMISSDGEIIAPSTIEHIKMEKLGKLDCKKQFKKLLYGDVRLSPSMFVNRTCFMHLNGCDLRIRNIEDYPLKLKFAEHGYKMGYVNNYTLLYRIHQSISHETVYLFPKKHIEQRHLLNDVWRYPYASKLWIVFWMAEMNDRVAEYVALKVLHNKLNSRNKMIIRFIISFNPKVMKDRAYRIIYRKKLKEEREQCKLLSMSFSHMEMKEGN